MQVLEMHLGIVGKTGSGKTNSAKVAIAQAVAAGHRVCVLDPIKSDYWGLTLNADGRTPGLPFRILGGPRAHVPLHSSAGAAVGEVVARGSLAHSILDMADFEPGGLQRFITDFAPVLMKRMTGALYLVLEEAHLFAPKGDYRSGIGQETMSIHWIKTLAAAGRSKGIRLIVVTQRTQALHNALLGACESLIVHRLTAPADQKPVLDWFKANATREQSAEVAATVASLGKGVAWVFSGEAAMCERMKIRQTDTFDNTGTPDGALAQDVQVPPVDLKELQSLMGEAVAVAEASDPKKLRERIQTLEAQLAVQYPVKMDDERVERLRSENAQLGQLLEAHQMSVREYQGWMAEMRAVLAKEYQIPKGMAVPTMPNAMQLIDGGSFVDFDVTVDKTKLANSPGGPAAKIVSAVAWWNAIGIPEPTPVQVGVVAGYSQGGTLDRYLSECRSRGLIEKGGRGVVSLTKQGKAETFHIGKSAPKTLQGLHDRIRELLEGGPRKLFDSLVSHQGRPIEANTLGHMAGYQPGGTLDRYLSELSSLGLITRAKGLVLPTEVVYPKGLK
jgi:hypothetical protein